MHRSRSRSGRGKRLDLRRERPQRDGSSERVSIEPNVRESLLLQETDRGTKVVAQAFRCKRVIVRLSTAGKVISQRGDACSIQCSSQCRQASAPIAVTGKAM